MDDFNTSLAKFVKSWCDAEDHKRRAELSIRQAEHEIVWLNTEIQKLELRLDRKPSTIRQINQYRHQIREIELKLAFDPSYQIKA